MTNRKQKRLLRDAMMGTLSFPAQHILIEESRKSVVGLDLRILSTLFFCSAFFTVFLFGSGWLENNGIPDGLSDLTQFALLIGIYFGHQFMKGKQLALQRAWVSKELLIRGVRPNLCLKCGYNLRGTTAQACPECGTALAPVDEPNPDD